jgi:hypothetical protein
VDTTRPNNSRAVGEVLLPSQRGAMGEGYDLVLSVHSNAASTSSVDHPVAIYTLDPRYSAISKDLGLKLATRVAQVMQTYEPPEVYSRAQSDGRDWYGINRGAADVGVPSIILEHSFHTNYRATVWLSQDANLRALAVAEAKVIADYYGKSAAVTGDVNGDGSVSISDLVLINRHLLGLQIITGDGLKASDVNNSATVTISDLVKLNRVLLGLDSITAY